MLVNVVHVGYRWMCTTVIQRFTLKSYSYFSPYEKLWNHLDNRKKRDLRSTNDEKLSNFIIHVFTHVLHYTRFVLPDWRNVDDQFIIHIWERHWLSPCPACISSRHTFIALFYTLPIFCDITNKVFIVFSFLGKLSFLQRLCKISLGLMVNFILFN